MNKRNPDPKHLSKEQLLELLSARDTQISSLNKMLSELAEQLRLQRYQKFGASSEKADPNQQPELFNEAEAEPLEDDGALTAQGLAEESDVAVEASDPESYPADKPVRKTPGRKALPANLKRKRVEHDIDEALKTCQCGCQKTKIGEEMSERLEHIPAQIFVEQHVRFKYACQHCEGELVIADPAPSMIPKSNAGADLLAFITTAKFQDALPLYRQQAIFKRLGIDLPRNTLANWVLKLSESVQPIIDQFEAAIQSAPVILMDETTVQVNREPGKRPVQNPICGYGEDYRHRMIKPSTGKILPCTTSAQAAAGKLLSTYWLTAKAH